MDQFTPVVAVEEAVVVPVVNYVTPSKDPVVVEVEVVWVYQVEIREKVVLKDPQVNLEIDLQPMEEKGVPVKVRMVVGVQ